MRKKIDKAAAYVTKKVGGSNLAEYAGAKIAKRTVRPSRRKYVKSKATGKQALVSAAKVAGASAGVAGAGRAIAGGLAKRGAKKVAKKAKMAARRRKSRKTAPLSNREPILYKYKKKKK